ncbi:TIGR02301 family protein [Bartonella bilalgolemii]|uniref:TIGR02301 family protein n=1 Tax=Bartonella bilalgolemii TaxID=2942911 RepID=A0ABT0P7Q8_9HYPH|nr:TIGR02301 family protein [Bartonella sp. G70]MCL6229506.1 TIGR02301 family protein [Bartonella sp. G70]
MNNILINIIFLIFFLIPTPTFAQQFPPYYIKFLRLAEILGSLHYLRNLCSNPTNQWYDHMVALIEAEKPTPQIRAHLYETFNAAYSAFSENYHRCTDSAIEADQRYVKEGNALSTSLLKHFNSEN